MARGIELKLPTVDDLFSTQEQREDSQREKVMNIPISEIDNFPEQPFLVRMDDTMTAMAESVRQVGIQTPAIVRRKDDGRYELVSGHRRKAAILSRLDTVPVIVRGVFLRRVVEGHKNIPESFLHLRGFILRAIL